MKGQPLRQRMPRVKAPLHLELIRGCPCLACGNSSSRNEAAHVSMSNTTLGKRGRGIGMKSDDCWVVPLCKRCHELQHGNGEPIFWDILRINPLMVAYALWLASGTSAMSLIVSRAREERNAK